MATNFGAKLATSPSFGTISFRNGSEYRNIDPWIDSADDLSQFA